MRIAVAGAGGRMGRSLVEAVLADPGLTLVAAFDVPGSPAVGQSIAGATVGADLRAAVAVADVVIDFTRPEGTLAHLAQARAMVIGTTGFSESQLETIRAKARAIPIVMAANFAVGVNAVYQLAETAARILGDDYDVEIVEAHHRHKVDAPSGTALRLGEVVAKALNRKLPEVARHGRHGETGERPAREIGFHSLRAGDIVGEHTVMFAGAGERVEITVRSQSRMTYALGALRAAKFLAGRAPGLYGMGDVLSV